MTPDDFIIGSSIESDQKYTSRNIKTTKDYTELTDWRAYITNCSNDYGTGQGYSTTFWKMPCAIVLNPISLCI